MKLARDYPSDFLRGVANGRASVLAELGIDPWSEDLAATDIVLPFGEYARLIAEAAASSRWQAEVKHLHTTLALLCAMGSAG